MVNGAHEVPTILTPSGVGVLIMSTMVRGLSKVLISLDGGDWQIDEIDERIQWIYQKKARCLMNTYTYL
jgi:hypothetical protein